MVWFLTSLQAQRQLFPASVNEIMRSWAASQAPTAVKIVEYIFAVLHNPARTATYVQRSQALLLALSSAPLGSAYLSANKVHQVHFSELPPVGSVITVPTKSG